MLKRLILAAFLFLPTFVWAQGGPPVQIQATITGSNGVPYANGTGSATILTAGNQQPTYNGYPVARTIPVVRLNGFGTLSMTVWQNNLLMPAGSQWSFRICDQTNVYCFTTPGITVNAPGDFSAAISAYAPPLPSTGGIPYPPAGVPVSNGTSGPWKNPSLGVQGTDSNALTSGTVSGLLNLLCLDSNGGATTVGCPTGGSGLLSTDNTWTNNNRFKGPDSGGFGRDISAFTGVGDCSTTDDPRSITASVGTIAATSNSLGNVGGIYTFKVGCGIAVLHAGPTSTIAPPGTGCTISSITSNGTLATITCTAAHGLFQGFNEDYAVQLSGVTDSGYDGTFQVNSSTTPTTIVLDCGNNTECQNGTSTSGGTLNALWGYAHGVTGSTTYNYWFVSVDSNMGYSAAVGPATIANGNATLTVKDTNGNANFNWLNVPPVENSYMVAVYQGSTESAATCVGVTFNMGYDDFGLTIPCPVFLPTHPPGSAGAQTLNTTITGISGSTITLAAAATNTATSQIIVHDESSFLNACLTAIESDQTNIDGDQAGSAGCYVPAAATPGGLWWMNGMITTGTTAPTQTTPIFLAGAMRFDLLPLFVEGGYNIQGVGGGGNYIGTYFNQPSTPIYFGPYLPAAIVFRKGAYGWQLQNLSMPNLEGYGLWMGDTWDDTGSVSAGLVNAVTIGLGSSAGGSPLWFDNNVIGVTITNSSFVPRDSGGQPFAVFTMSDYGGNTLGNIYLSGIDTEFHGIRIDSPACNFTGGIIGAPNIGGWESESLHDPYVVQFDNSSCAPGGQQAFAGFSVSGSFADSSAVPLVHMRCGQQTGLSGGCASFEGATVGPSSGQPYLLSCGPDPSCDSPGVGFLNFGGPDTNALGSLGEGGTGISVNGTRLLLNSEPLAVRPNRNTTSQSYYQALWDGPYQPTYGIGSGSLAAGPFCFEIFGVDLNGAYSEPSTEKCVTLSANSSIFGSGFQVTSPYAFVNYAFYYCVNCSSGGENKYIIESGTSFNLSSDSGASGSPPTSFGASLSGLFWSPGYDCLLCGATPTSYPLGLGVWPGGAEATGVKLDVSAAVRAREYGFWSDEYSAPSCNSGEDQMWGDSSAHRWRMCNNNGSVTSVAGLSDFAAPPAIGNVTPAAGTFTQLNLAEGSAPSAISATSVFWGNSATHWPQFNPNNSGAHVVLGATGTLTPGDCLEVNTAAGEIIDAGGACGSGGSGSVTSVNMENITTGTQNLATCATVDPSTTADITCTLANAPAHTVFMNNTGSGAAPDFQSINEASLPNTTVFTDTANTFGAHLNDLSAATIKLPVAAGATTSANGNIIYDTTNKNWHIWDDAADRLLPVFSTTPANGQCVTTSVSSSIVLLVPGSCTSGFTPQVNSVNLSTTTGINLLNTAGASGINFTNPGTTQVQASLASVAGGGNATLQGTLTGFAQYNYLCGNSTPIIVNCQPGLMGRAITGSTTTDTVTATDVLGGVIDHDQGATGAVAETLPTATSLAAPLAVFRYTNHSPKSDTITPTTWTIQQGTAAAGSSLVVPPGYAVLIKVDPNSSTNWLADMTQMYSDCTSGATPAVCGAANSGSVAIPTGVNPTLVVQSSAVTANSKILFYPDDTLGTKLSVTCNSTLATLVGGSAITARTAGTSFTITLNGTVTTNPVCGSFVIQ